jgi:hypothetical protein
VLHSLKLSSVKSALKFEEQQLAFPQHFSKGHITERWVFSEWNLPDFSNVFAMGFARILATALV